MNEFRRHKETITNIALALAAVALIVYAVYSQRTWSETNNIIHSHNFTGTVVGKEAVTQNFGLGRRRFTVYRLHVIGEYFGNNERIEVDRVFVVSAEIYHRFEIGDTIPDNVR